MKTEEPENPRELGYYFALAQVGLEMVVPLGLGVYLDYLLGWSPWCLVVGTLLGFVGGLFHLISLAKQQEDERTGKPPKDERS